MKKRILSLVLVCALLLGSWATATAGAYELWYYFSDVPEGKWFAEAVNGLAQQGIVGGTQDGNFHPQKNISRAEFLKLLAESSGMIILASGTSSFEDVSIGAWYADYVEWGVKYGVINGVGNGKFSPNAPVTRQQAATILSRYNRNVMGRVLPQNKHTNFKDAASISGWAGSEVAAAEGAGLLNGYEDRCFRPRRNTTRAEAAQIVYKYFTTCETYRSACTLDEMRLIMHGGGAIDYGYDYVTNSLEALNSSYRNGHRVIEVDLSWTSDHQLALIHNWGGTFPPLSTLSQFLSTKILGKYTGMSLDMLAKWMRAHPDVWVIPDVKKKNAEVLQKIAGTYPDLVSHFIPYIYHKNEINALKQAGYATGLLTTYQMTESERSDAEGLVDFIRQHHLFGLVVGTSVEDKYFEAANSKGVPLLVFTVDNQEYGTAAMNRGADGFFTNVQHLPSPWG